MKVNILLLLFGLFFGTMATAQVKIGDNPQNIGAASVLELESSTRALVITRVTTVQMNAIVPLEGAMVYNTDAQCIYYYNGTEWLNLCDALNNSISISLTDNGNGTYTFTDAQDNTTEILVRNQSLVVEDGNLILTEGDGNQLTVALNSLNTLNFTTDGIVNEFRNTVVITPSDDGTSFNFEVGLISGENIQEASILQGNLAPNSVGRVQLADNAVGAMEIYNDSVTAAKINRDVAGSGLRQAVNGALEVDIENIQGDGTLTTGNGALLVTGTPANALLADVDLAVMVDSTTIGIDPTTGLEVMDNGITNLQMGDLSIGTDELINDAVTSAKIAPNTITAADINTGAVTTDEILNLTVATADIADDAITLPKLANGTATGQIMQWDGTLNEWVLISLGDQTVTEVDGIVGNEVTNATVNGGLIRVGDGTFENQYTLGVNTGIGLINNATGQLDLELGEANQILSTNGTSDDIDWIDAPTGVPDLTDAQIIVANDTVPNAVTMAGDATIDNAGIITIANDSITAVKINADVAGTGLEQNASTGSLDISLGTANQILSTNGTEDDAVWIDSPTGVPDLTDAQIIVANDTVPTAVTMAGDATIDNAGIITIANDSITAIKINENVAGRGLEKNGLNGALDITLGEANQILSTNAAQDDAVWINAPSGVPDLTDAQIIVANDTVPTAVTMAGDATIDNAGIITIANDSITAVKINADVAGTGLEQNASTGALDLFHGTPNQILRTNADGDAAEWATIPTVVAAGKVAADVNPLENNVMGATITHNGADSGNYSVTDLTTSTPDFIIQLTVFNAPEAPAVTATRHTIQVTEQTADGFTVQIFDTAGNPIDAAWYFTVTDF